MNEEISKTFLGSVLELQITVYTLVLPMNVLQALSSLRQLVLLELLTELSVERMIKRRREDDTLNYTDRDAE